MTKMDHWKNILGYIDDGHFFVLVLQDVTCVGSSYMSKMCLGSN